MESPNRRREQRPDVIEILKAEYRVQDVIDYGRLPGNRGNQALAQGFACGLATAMTAVDFLGLAVGTRSVSAGTLPSRDQFLDQLQQPQRSQRLGQVIIESGRQRL